MDFVKVIWSEGNVTKAAEAAYQIFNAIKAICQSAIIETQESSINLVGKTPAALLEMIKTAYELTKYIGEIGTVREIKDFVHDYLGNLLQWATENKQDDLWEELSSLAKFIN